MEINMRKVMTILAVAALSASTAFAGGVEDATGDAPTLVQTPASGTICTNSIVEAAACGVVAACVGGLCGGGSSTSSPTTPAGGTPASGT